MDSKKKRPSKTRKRVRGSATRTRETKLFLVAFGKRVKELRERDGVSQSQLGFESGMSRTTINRIEKGHYDTGISSLFILAQALQVSEADLLDFDGKQ